MGEIVDFKEMRRLDYVRRATDNRRRELSELSDADLREWAYTRLSPRHRRLVDQARSLISGEVERLLAEIDYNGPGPSEGGAA